MMRQEFRLTRNPLGKAPLHDFSDARMQLLPITAQKRAVGGILNQSVLEEVSRMGRRALSEQQAGANETVQRRSQFRLPLAYQRGQQRIRKLAPNRGPDLRDLLGWAEPVEPRHKRRVQAGRDRQRMRWNRASDSPRFVLALRLQHRLGHLLHEQ